MSDHYREEIKRAIEVQEAIEFGYPQRIIPEISLEPIRTHTLTRTFSPWEIKGESVFGYDHGRDEPRRFRFDKMIGTIYAADEDYVQPQ